jgi:glutathione S-transferase
MTLIMYERVGFEGRRLSPFSWRIRYALAHKGADVDYRPARFADVATIEQLSGQRFVPIVVDGAHVVHDSWNIARYLEQKYPDRPPLFGDDAAVSAIRLINLWSDNTLNPLVRPLISADFVRCVAPEDRDYFRSSREKAFGRTLEAAAAERAQIQPQLEAACLPLERLLAEQPFVGGQAPRYGDYILFSVFQWARLGSPSDIVPPGSQIACWRTAMCSLFDGLADRFPGYPA